MPKPDGSHIGRINTVRMGPRGGTPVVLVHPVGLDLTYWGDQIEALGDTFDLVAFDLPGHGRSPGQPSDCTLDHAAATLEDVIRSTGAARAHVVGLSVGGMIAQALASSRPEVVSSLILIDTAAVFADEARGGMRARAALAREGGMSALIPATLERWFGPRTRARRPDLIERVTRTLLDDDPLIHAAMWDMIAVIDLVDDLHRIVCPTLILVGEHDSSTPPASAEIMERHISRSEMRVVPGASHLSVLEQPSVLNEHLISFLSRLR